MPTPKYPQDADALWVYFIAQAVGRLNAQAGDSLLYEILQQITVRSHKGDMPKSTKECRKTAPQNRQEFDLAVPESFCIGVW